MRLASFVTPNGSSDIGVANGDGIVALGKRLKISSLRQLLAEQRLDEARTFQSQTPDFNIDEITFLPVIPDASHFICVGTNYDDHLKEVQAAGIARPQPKAPALFARYPESLTGHLTNLVMPGFSDDFDYEGELAVIIGRGGRNIPEIGALEHVAGYSCFNDGSIRDWQFHTSQVMSGKNFVATGGFGPWLVSADEIPDPQALSISTRINGVTLQESNTSAMIFTVAKIISYASTMFPLLPGDVFATGTPSGVGFSRKPPIFMKHDDMCEVIIDKVGTLSNPVVKEIIPPK